MLELRAQTALVCGFLALAIAVSSLLRPGPRRVHLLFAAFAATLGVLYLVQGFSWLSRGDVPLYAFEDGWEAGPADFLQRITGGLALLLPLLALPLFESMVPRDAGLVPPAQRFARVVGLLLLLLQFLPFHSATWVRVLVFVYVFAVITLSLYELGKRGKRSPSRATQRRVRWLVVIGSLAGIATIADLLWFLGLPLPPLGAVLAIVLLFALSQALVSERLLDLGEMVGRLIVFVGVASLIAVVFYGLLTYITPGKTTYVNMLAVGAILFVVEPLRARLHEQIRRRFFRERFDFERELTDLRRHLDHPLDVAEMCTLVKSALERSRRVTSVGLYLRDEDGTGFDQIASLGEGVPQRIEVQTARALLDELEKKSILLEDVERDASDKQRGGPRNPASEGMLTAAEVLGDLRGGVLVAIRDEEREISGLLVLADSRVKDAISPEEVALLEQLAAQIGLVIEHSRYNQQKKVKDRLLFLGELATVLAHEIRNPLASIKGAAQLLAEPPTDGAEHDSREFLGIILEEVARLNRLVDQVRDLGPGGKAELPVDVNVVIRRTLQLVSVEPSNELVEITPTLASDLPKVAIDPEKLQQVLMNLIRNGVQAMNERGKLNVSSRVRFGRGTRSGKYDGVTSVEITVADTGTGISRTAFDKLFMPFFTTKGKGTGLGLAISERIVQGAGGRIEPRSSDKGSTFTVVLPAAPESLVEPAQATSAAPVAPA